MLKSLPTMDQPVSRQAPYFDFDLLRQETGELARKHAGQDTQLRAELVAYLKPLVAEAHEVAEQQLKHNGDGRKCAGGLSDFQEIHKYRTDPAKVDSDGDGVLDGEWRERRERGRAE